MSDSDWDADDLLDDLDGLMVGRCTTASIKICFWICFISGGNNHICRLFFFLFSLNHLISNGSLA